MLNLQNFAIEDDVVQDIHGWTKWQEKPSQDFIHQVQRGMLGKNVGLGNGLHHINKYLYGTHQGRYYLIGADSGVGKTTLTDFMFVLNAWQEAKRTGRRIKIFYCSFEIGRADKIARWTSYWVYLQHGIRLPSDYILGRISGKLLSKSDFALVQRAYAIIMEMMKDITFIDIMMHPTMIFEGIIDGHYEKQGTVSRMAQTEEDKKKKRKGFVKSYKANDPDLMTMLVVDHMALTNQESGLDTKGIIDRLSKYGVILRNIFHTTIVFIQQFSTDMLAANRIMHIKKTEESIMPTRLDFGDSKTTFRDADVVMGLIQPGRDLTECFGYNVTTSGIGLYMVLACIVKNRYGSPGRMSPLFLDGVTGCAYDLPYPCNEMIEDDWNNKAKEIDDLCQVYFPQ